VIKKYSIGEQNQFSPSMTFHTALPQICQRWI